MSEHIERLVDFIKRDEGKDTQADSETHIETIEDDDEDDMIVEV